MDRVSPAFAILAVVAGFGASSPAAAVTQFRAQSHGGANACTLSVPTTDTQVRPRATGFKNEGNINAFVICTFTPPEGSTGVFPGIVQYVVMFLKSMDGLEHTVKCTAVNSMEDGTVVGFPPQTYVTKNIVVNDTGPMSTFGVQAEWLPQDFTGSSTDTAIPSSDGVMSVTCVLPPRVSIKLGGTGSLEDVGN